MKATNWNKRASPHKADIIADFDLSTVYCRNGIVLEMNKFHKDESVTCLMSIKEAEKLIKNLSKQIESHKEKGHLE